jgi:hypothetical protein
MRGPSAAELMTRSTKVEHLGDLRAGEVAAEAQRKHFAVGVAGAGPFTAG